MNILETRKINRSAIFQNVHSKQDLIRCVSKRPVESMTEMQRNTYDRVQR